MNIFKKIAQIIGALADFFRAIGILKMKTPVDLKDLKPGDEKKPSDLA